MICQSFLYIRRERKSNRSTYLPKTAVIAPHYGWESDTEKHVKSLLNQDYDGEYHIYFITHEINGDGYDKSYPYLQNLVEDKDNADVRLAPNIIDNNLPRSQKIQNLITVIETLPKDVEVIAFVDADVEIQQDWLSLLVTPLQNKEIGVTVGGRFYSPQNWNFPTFVEAIWVNYQLGLQGDHPFTMVWGGSNAFRRELLNQGEILKRWENATIEDLNTTKAVRDLKLKIHFVPDCIAVTRTQNRTWKQVIEFTNRQMIMTRHMGLLAQWFGTLIMFFPKGLLIFGSIPFIYWYQSLLPIVFIPFFEIFVYHLVCKNLPKWLREKPNVNDIIRVSKYVAPISIFLAGINAFYAIFQRRIVWGGVQYEILSATTCKVIGRIKKDE
ncbi:glycosyltransferase family 2 protein [Candidatus Poribacteria bacterium]|nr:glycosyltransferase family 2 protein [Candidatus Poribacteria bacterium]